MKKVLSIILTILFILILPVNLFNITISAGTEYNVKANSSSDNRIVKEESKKVMVKQENYKYIEWEGKEILPKFQGFKFPFLEGNGVIKPNTTYILSIEYYADPVSCNSGAGIVSSYIAVKTTKSGSWGRGNEDMLWDEEKKALGSIRIEEEGRHKFEAEFTTYAEQDTLLVTLLSGDCGVAYYWDFKLTEKGGNGRNLMEHENFYGEWQDYVDAGIFEASSPLSPLSQICLSGQGTYSFIPFNEEIANLEYGKRLGGEYKYAISDGKVTITGVHNEIKGKIIIPSTIGGYPVTSISSGAFSKCTGITSITIPKSVTSIGLRAFGNGFSLESIIVDKENAIYRSENNCLIKKATNELVYGCKNSVIPNSVKSIGMSAFSGSTGLTNIIIPKGVTSIGDRAFYGCKDLTNATVGSSVTTIGKDAFNGCSSLQKITLPFIGAELNGTESTHFGSIFGAANKDGQNNYIPASLKTVVINGGSIIDDSAFYKCNKIKEIIITDNVKELGNRAFEWCSELETLYIPKSVKKIGNQTFEKCNMLTIYSCKDAEELVKNTGIDYVISNNYKDLTGVTYGEECGTSNHVFGSWSQTKAPTCTTKGIESRTCSTCKKVQTRDIKERGHNLGGWTQTEAPSCESKGEETRNCSKCSFKETRVINALGHKFSNPTVTKQPTCTETGIESGKCTVCKKNTTNTIKATGHKMGSSVVTLEPTCIAEGKKEGTCTVCGANAEEVIAAKGHTFGEAVVTKEATEIETGIKTAICTVCGQIKEEEIPYISIEQDLSKEEKTDMEANSENKDNGNDMLWIIFTLSAVVILLGATLTVILIKNKKTKI